MLRIASVQYYNSIPFQFALNQLQEQGFVDWIAATPSECGRLLKSGEVDVALLPVGAALDYERLFVVTDYCIACENAVRTVKLFYNDSWEKVQQIILDKDSRTSNLLVQCLNQNFWKRTDIHFVQSGDEDGELNSAWLRIGDEAFAFEKKFVNSLDLGAEWKKWTGLPFVFALWVSIEKPEPDMIHKLQKAFTEAIHQIPDLLQSYPDDIRSLLVPYFKENISFRMDGPKREAISRFFEWAGKDNPLLFSY